MNNSQTYLVFILYLLDKTPLLRYTGFTMVGGYLREGMDWLCGSSGRISTGSPSTRQVPENVNVLLGSASRMYSFSWSLMVSS